MSRIRKNRMDGFPTLTLFAHAKTPRFFGKAFFIKERF